MDLSWLQYLPAVVSLGKGLLDRPAEPKTYEGPPANRPLSESMPPELRDYLANLQSQSAGFQQNVINPLQNVDYNSPYYKSLMDMVRARASAGGARRGVYGGAREGLMNRATTDLMQGLEGQRMGLLQNAYGQYNSMNQAPYGALSGLMGRSDQYASGQVRSQMDADTQRQAAENQRWQTIMKGIQGLADVYTSQAKGVGGGDSGDSRLMPKPNAAASVMSGGKYEYKYG